MTTPVHTDIGYSLRIALKECAHCAPHSPYIWKPKTMQKLEKLGLVEPDQLMAFGRVAYHVTTAGHALLSDETVNTP